MSTTLAFLGLPFRFNLGEVTFAEFSFGGIRDKIAAKEICRALQRKSWKMSFSSTISDGCADDHLGKVEAKNCCDDAIVLPVNVKYIRDVF